MPTFRFVRDWEHQLELAQETRQSAAPVLQRERPESVHQEVECIKPWLSVVIPAKDESQRLPTTLRLLMQHLKMLAIEYEIIVVDDGSCDGTQEKLMQVFSTEVRAVRHEKRKGIAAAFRSGVSKSAGEYVMLCPADICDFSFLSDAVTNCRHFDIVSVSKRHPESVVVGYDKWRWFLSDQYHRIVTLLFRIPKRCRDTHYVKIYRSDLLKEILPFCVISGAVGETEIVFYAARNGAKMLDIPGRIVHNGNGSKTSLGRVVETSFDLMRLWLHLHI